ncbi:hypothetical protein [Paenibacillus nasutitermitis]|uniref:Uncharacterized protein n=1 Tax=Paenibacillus nasutitermitis TaxID=1652958 RepID=A0A916Z4W0_9BACL|nr:hypothetical protein [Paenibacillus nasutitermitis]GGD76549.1 hypothetical protein GCM10010911_38280 [Paenibacillus nasutitermitis]
MVSVISVLAIGLAIAAYELPDLFRKRQKKEVIFVSILLAIGIVLSSMATKPMNLPSPLNVLKLIYKPISELVFNENETRR